MKIRMILLVDEKNIAQLDVCNNNELLEEDINSILNSKQIPADKTIEVMTKILNNKY